MAFDKDQPDQPLIHPERRATKVNLVMAAAIVVFLAIGIIITWYALTRDRSGASMDRPPTRQMNP
jgi:hypothetical protein